MMYTSARGFVLAAVTLSGVGALPAVGQVIDERVKLLAEDGDRLDTFGSGVAISGSTGVIGASQDDDNGNGSGSAYLFDTTTGEQFAKLLPVDGETDDAFGESVAISGTTAVVGASGDDDNGSASGSAYVFDTLTGQQIAKLVPGDGTKLDQFGESVSISGSIVIVGARWDNDNGFASGSAYLFDALTGQQIAKLLPSDGAAFDEFGWSVAVSGSIAVIGAPFDNDNGPLSGSAYLFDTTTGEQLAKLLPSDGSERDWFGNSVAIDGTTVIVGAYQDDDNGIWSGSAYLFDTTTGEQLAKLLPDDGDDDLYFGRSVSISGTTAFVGSNRDDANGTYSGSAYLFDTTTGDQLAKLLPSDGAAFDEFGFSVAIDGTTALVGSHLDDDNGSGSGSAYVFSAVPCAPDLTGDGVLNFFDVAAFVAAFGAAEPAADFNGDGMFNFFDVSAFLGAYAAGCP